MTNRSANATIKGYFYQFDHTALQLLSLTDNNQFVKIEVIEDVDISNPDFEQLIQCKYYEQSEYNHSVIKPAIIEMLKHFSLNKSATKFKYKLYGYYKSGQEKLVLPLTRDFLKQNFLKYEEKGVLHEVWKKLSISDKELEDFINLLEINNKAKSFDEQMIQINNLLKQKIDNCTDEDIEYFYFPLALDVIRKLAIEPHEEDRKITGKAFLSNINVKDKVFNSWQLSYLGEEKYNRYLNKKHFKDTSSTATLRAARFFVIQCDDFVISSDLIDCIKKISNKFSHKEHRRTSDKDRFCPYLFIQGYDEQKLIDIKKQLKSIGLDFIDGYAFKGADFDVYRVCISPSKDNQIKLKVLNSIDELIASINYMHKQHIELFEFYRSSPTTFSGINDSIKQNIIKISNIASIKEIIK